MRAINVLHIIETLDRGGAELLFVNYINALPEAYKNHIVILRLPDTLKSNLRNFESLHVLNYTSKKDFLPAVLKLRKLINSNQIDLVHAHLYWPTAISRFVVNSNVPLVFSVHNLISEDAFNLNILSKYLEKLTYSPKHAGLFVSEAVYNDYRAHIHVKGCNKVLYNFVRPEFFLETNHKTSFLPGALRLVSIGNLRTQKNYLFLVKSMGKLMHLPITLDIYGEGPERAALEAYIEHEKVINVRLMGSISAPEDILKHYDVFISGSKYEGFYIAMVEAMAVGLPCILPAIEVLKEVSGGEQVYYEQGNERDLIKKILMFFEQPLQLNQFAANAVKAAEKYTIGNHINNLTEVYRLALHGKNR